MLYKMECINPPDEIPKNPTKILLNATMEFNVIAFCNFIKEEVPVEIRSALNLWNNMLAYRPNFELIYFDAEPRSEPSSPKQLKNIPKQYLFKNLFEYLRDNYKVLNYFITLRGEVQEFKGTVDKETREAYLMTQPRNFLLCFAQENYFGDYSDTFSGVTAKDSMEIIAYKVMKHQKKVITAVLEEVDTLKVGESDVVYPYSMSSRTARCRIIKWVEDDVEYCRASWLVKASVKERYDHKVCMYALCAKLKKRSDFAKLLADGKPRNVSGDKWYSRLYVIDANEFSLFTPESLAPGESLQEERGLWGGVCMFVAHRAFLLATRGGWHRFRGGNHIRAILECANAVGEYMYPIVGNHEKVKAEFLRREYGSKISVMNRRALTTGFTPIKALYLKETYTVGRYFFAAPATTPKEVMDSFEDTFKDTLERKYAFYDLKRMRDIDGLSFEGNESVEYVHLPRAMETIPDNFFSGCTKLQMVYDMEKIKTIGEGAFAGTMMGMSSPASASAKSSPASASAKSLPASPSSLNTSIRSISSMDLQYSPKKLDFTDAELDAFEISLL